MNQSVERLAGLLLCGLGAWAQSESPKIVVNVDGFRYPRLARMARIQGDVRFEVTASGPRVVTAAHPVLAEAARRNLGTWTLPYLDGGAFHVWYHFSLSGEPGTKHETVQVGDPFDRFFLRLFHAPTEKVVQVCDSDAPTETQARRAPNEDGGGYEVRVFVASRNPCPASY